MPTNSISVQRTQISPDNGENEKKEFNTIPSPSQPGTLTPHLFAGLKHKNINTYASNAPTR
jgi:hypothetical protein